MTNRSGSLWLAIFCFAGSIVAATAGGVAADSMPSCAAGDPVVWENSSSKVYHESGDSYYGKTKHGQYACKSDADKAGYHLAKSGTSGTSSSGTAAGSSSGLPASAAPAATGSPSSKHHHHHKSTVTGSPAPAATAT